MLFLLSVSLNVLLLATASSNNRLKVKYGVFNDLPRTAAAAKAAQPMAWIKHYDGCKDNKTIEGKWPGQHYRLDDDQSLTLIFDTDGSIAVMMQTMPASAVYNEQFRNSMDKMFNPKYFVSNQSKQTKRQTSKEQKQLIAYDMVVLFVQPDKVCNPDSNRKENIDTKNTVEQYLYLMYDQGKFFDRIPLHHSELAASDKGWVRGKCLHGMGTHYWKVSQDMKCENWYPYCLLYWEEKLIGLCYATMFNFDRALPKQPSVRLEHSPVGLSMECCIKNENIPTCAADTYIKEKQLSLLQATTMHVYFNANQNEMCPDNKDEPGYGDVTKDATKDATEDATDGMDVDP